MRFDWQQYLQLAKSLRVEGSVTPYDEAKLRSAISRAYYAAHCSAADFMHRRGWQFPRRNRRPRGDTRGSHEVLHDEMAKLSDPNGYLVAQKLRDMKLRRVNADYFGDYDRSVNDLNKILIAAQDNVSLSEQVIQLIKGLR